MPKRQSRFAPEEIAAEGRLEDHSAELWNPELGDAERRLLTSAVRCFAANGYHATTTRDITAGLGLSPAALYAHFPSKELVLYEIMRAGHQHALACAREPAAGAAGNAADRLASMVFRYTAWHARHHVAARVCQYGLTGLSPAHYDEIIRLRHLTNETFREVIEEGVAQGTFAPADVSRLLRGMLSLSIDLVRWYRLDGPDSPEELAEFHASLALRMVMSKDAAQAG